MKAPSPHWPEFRQFAVLVGHIVALTLLEFLLIDLYDPGIPSIKIHVLRQVRVVAGMDGAIVVLYLALAELERRVGILKGTALGLAGFLFGLETLAWTFLCVASHISLEVLGCLANGALITVSAIEAVHWLQAHGGIFALVAAGGGVLLLVVAAYAMGRIVLKGMPALKTSLGWRGGRALSAALALLYLVGAIKLTLEVGLVPTKFTPADDPVLALRAGGMVNITGSTERSREERATYAAATRGRGNGKNIIIIASDSVRADHLPLYGYPRDTTPFLQELAEKGELHRVDVATSNCSESVCGIFSILGSKLLAHAAPSANFMLHDLLRDHGYHIHFILSGTHSGYLLLPQFYGPLSNFDDYTDGDISGRGEDDRHVLERLDSLPPDDGGSHMFFIFLMSSHVLGDQIIAERPYSPLPETFNPTHLFSNARRHTLSDDEKQRNINRYDNGIFQADWVIRQIFAKLGAKGYLRDAVAAITADHGDALGERGLYAHGMYIYREFVGIPILIWDPTPTRYANLAFADQTDISVTLLDRAGLPKPPSWEGRSLIDGEPRVYAFTQNDHLGERPCRGAYDRQPVALTYLIQCVTKDNGVHEEIFDLTADPLGLRSAANSTPPAVVDDLRKRLTGTFPLRGNQY